MRKKKKSNEKKKKGLTQAAWNQTAASEEAEITQQTTQQREVATTGAAITGSRGRALSAESPKSEASSLGSRVTESPFGVPPLLFCFLFFSPPAPP